MRTQDRVTSACQNMTAVDDGYRRLCPPTLIRRGAARRGPAREHPGGPFGNEHGRRRPRKPRRCFGRWSPLVGLGHKSRRTHSLKGIVPEVAAHVSVLLGVACGGGNVAQPHASTAAFTAGMRCVQAAGWHVELTQRGFLQELGSDCGHMAARNAPKQLQCMQCELYKSRGGYKTKQWTQLRAGDRLCKVCEDLVAAASVAHVAHAATPSSPAVIHTFALEFVSTSVNIFSCPAEVVLFSHGFKLWSGCRAEVIQLLKLLLRRPRCSERSMIAIWQDDRNLASKPRTCSRFFARCTGRY